MAICCLTPARFLKTQEPIEREIEGHGAAPGSSRRILPYRTRDKKTEGVVITFVDMTERRSTADALIPPSGKRSWRAPPSRAFSRRRATICASPCRPCRCSKGLLAKKVTGEKEQKLVGRMDEALGAMTSMLNTLLDINQIEVGAVKVEAGEFPVSDILRPPQERTDAIMRNRRA